MARRGGERVAQGVAAFHGRVEGVQATLRTLVLGTRSADLLPSADRLAALPAPDAGDAGDDARDAEALAEQLSRDGAMGADGHTPRATGEVG